MIHLLEEQVDFDRVNNGSATKVFTTPTEVSTFFQRYSVRARLAWVRSWAIPVYPICFKAVETDGEAYWDGGSSGSLAPPVTFNSRLIKGSLSIALLQRIGGNPRQLASHRARPSRLCARHSPSMGRNTHEGDRTAQTVGNGRQTELGARAFHSAYLKAS